MDNNFLNKTYTQVSSESIKQMLLFLLWIVSIILILFQFYIYIKHGPNYKLIPACKKIVVIHSVIGIIAFIFWKKGVMSWEQLKTLFMNFGFEIKSFNKGKIIGDLGNIHLNCRMPSPYNFFSGYYNIELSSTLQYKFKFKWPRKKVLAGWDKQVYIPKVIIPYEAEELIRKAGEDINYLNTILISDDQGISLKIYSAVEFPQTLKLNFTNSLKFFQNFLKYLEQEKKDKQ